MKEKKLNELINEYRAIPRSSDRDLERSNLTTAKMPKRVPFYRHKAVWGGIAALIAVAIALPISLTFFYGNGNTVSKDEAVMEDTFPVQEGKDAGEYDVIWDGTPHYGKSNRSETGSAIVQPEKIAADSVRLPLTEEDVEYVLQEDKSENGEHTALYDVVLCSTGEKVGVYERMERTDELFEGWETFGYELRDERFDDLTNATFSDGTSYRYRKEIAEGKRIIYAEYRANGNLYRCMITFSVDKACDEESLLEVYFAVLSSLR